MTLEHPDQHDTEARAASQEEPPASEQAIMADIERTRAALGETVEQLAAKAHIGARARQAVSDRARAIPAAARSYRTLLAGAALALALAVAAARKLRR